MKYLITISLLLLFASCRTMKKNSHSVYNSIDSSASVAKTEDRVTTDKTVKVEETTGEKSGKVKIVLEYDGDKEPITFLPEKDSSITGKIITALTTGLKKATIEGDFNSITNSKTTTNTDKTDSMSKQEDAKADVKKASEEVVKNKQVTGVPWYATTLFWMIIAIIVIAFIIYKKSWFMKFFKNLLAKLLLFTVLLFAFACNNPDGKTYPTDPVATGWDKGVQTYSEYVIIQPTWGQAFYYNNRSGNAWELVVGFILLFASAMWFILLTKKVLKITLVNILGFVILLIAASAFIFTGPGTIKWNNQIRIEKSYYDQHSNDLPALWDDLYSQKRIVGTSGQ